MAPAVNPKTDQTSKDRLKRRKEGKKVYLNKLFHLCFTKVVHQFFEANALGTALAVVSKKIVSQLHGEDSTYDFSQTKNEGVTPALASFFFLRMAAATHPMTDQFSKDRLNEVMLRGGKKFSRINFLPSEKGCPSIFDLLNAWHDTGCSEQKIVNQLS